MKASTATSSTARRVEHVGTCSTSPYVLRDRFGRTPIGPGRAVTAPAAALLDYRGLGAVDEPRTTPFRAVFPCAATKTGSAASSGVKSAKRANFRPSGTCFCAATSPVLPVAVSPAEDGSRRSAVGPRDPQRQAGELPGTRLDAAQIQGLDDGHAGPQQHLVGRG